MIVEADGSPSEGRRSPSSELPLHVGVFAARPDVRAIVHSHSPFATTFAIARREIPAVHYVMALLVAPGRDTLRVAPYATFGTRELADQAVAALGARQRLPAREPRRDRGGRIPRERPRARGAGRGAGDARLARGAARRPGPAHGRRARRRPRADGPLSAPERPRDRLTVPRPVGWSSPLAGGPAMPGPSAESDSPARRASIDPEMPAEYGIGKATDHVDWSHVEERLNADRVYWIATVSASGRPRVRPVDGMYLDGVLYVGGALETQWVRELAANPQVSIHLDGGDDVVIVDGEAEILNGVDAELAAKLAAVSNAKFPEYGMTADSYGGPGPIAITAPEGHRLDELHEGPDALHVRLNIRTVASSPAQRALSATAARTSRATAADSSTPASGSSVRSSCSMLRLRP